MGMHYEIIPKAEEMSYGDFKEYWDSVETDLKLKMPDINSDITQVLMTYFKLTLSELWSIKQFEINKLINLVNKIRAVNQSMNEVLSDYNNNIQKQIKDFEG